MGLTCAGCQRQELFFLSWSESHLMDVERLTRLASIELGIVHWTAGQEISSEYALRLFVRMSKDRTSGRQSLRFSLASACTLTSLAEPPHFGELIEHGCEKPEPSRM